MTVTLGSTPVAVYLAGLRLGKQLQRRGALSRRDLIPKRSENAKRGAS